MEASAGRDELIIVLAVTAVFFLLGLIAVGIFIRVWHKEKKARRAAAARTQAHPDTRES